MKTCVVGTQKTVAMRRLFRAPNSRLNLMNCPASDNAIYKIIQIYDYLKVGVHAGNNCCHRNTIQNVVACFHAFVANEAFNTFLLNAEICIEAMALNSAKKEIFKSIFKKSTEN